MTQKTETQQTGRLSGKVALVTGASSGIGAATALALAQEGASVALVARRQERLEDLARQIRDMGGQAEVLALDIVQAEAASQAVERTVLALGGLDILVNNAGLMLLGPVAGADPSDFSRMLDLNVLAVMNLTHAALETMKPQRSGHIVNVYRSRGAGPGRPVPGTARPSGRWAGSARGFGRRCGSTTSALLSSSRAWSPPN